MPPPLPRQPSALAGQRIPPYWRGARVELRQRRFQRVYTRQGSRAITGGRLAQQLHDSREFFFGKLLDRHAEDIGMAEPQEESEVERVIVAAIYRHARGNVIYLARPLSRICARLVSRSEGRTRSRSGATLAAEFGGLPQVSTKANGRPISSGRQGHRGYRRGWGIASPLMSLISRIASPAMSRSATPKNRSKSPRWCCASARYCSRRTR